MKQVSHQVVAKGILLVPYFYYPQGSPRWRLVYKEKA